MKNIRLFFIVVLLSAAQQSFGQKIPPFDKIGKEIFFVDTLILKNEVELKISELIDVVKNTEDSVLLAKACYNLALCYAAKKDTENVYRTLKSSIYYSPIFHNLILSDSDFNFLNQTDAWNEIVQIVDSIHLQLNPKVIDRVLTLKLYHIFLKDQQSRGFGIKREDALYNYQSENQKQVEEIIDEYGWPTFSMVGKMAAQGAFLVIQHSNPEVQMKYFNKLSEAAFQNEADKESYALLTDRLSIHSHGYQIYGTQVARKRDKSTGKLGSYFYFPIKDEHEVDARRKAFGMVSLKTYYATFGITYVPVSK